MGLGIENHENRFAGIERGAGGMSTGTGRKPLRGQERLGGRRKATRISRMPLHGLEWLGGERETLKDLKTAARTRKGGGRDGYRKRSKTATRTGTRGNGDVAPPGREECGWEVGGWLIGWGRGGWPTGRPRQDADGEGRGKIGRGPWRSLTVTGGEKCGWSGKWRDEDWKHLKPIKW